MTDFIIPCRIAERRVWPQTGGLFGAPCETIYERRSDAQQRYFEILVKARQHMEKYGWARNWGSFGQPTCIMGAIAVGVSEVVGADHGLLNIVGRSTEAEVLARFMDFGSVDSAIGWNDRMLVGGKQATVDRLNKAIDKLRPPVSPPAFKGEIKVSDQRVKQEDRELVTV